MRNVLYCYVIEDFFGIFNFNLNIELGDFVGIVGLSGLGKFIIFEFIYRYIELDDGEILLDGVLIKELDIYELRKYVGYFL